MEQGEKIFILEVSLQQKIEENTLTNRNQGKSTGLSTS